MADKAVTIKCMWSRRMGMDRPLYCCEACGDGKWRLHGQIIHHLRTMHGMDNERAIAMMEGARGD